jgi:predicted transcriptional regulator
LRQDREGLPAGYQTRINQVLRAFYEARGREAGEATLVDNLSGGQVHNLLDDIRYNAAKEKARALKAEESITTDYIICLEDPPRPA